MSTLKFLFLFLLFLFDTLCLSLHLFLLFTELSLKLFLLLLLQKFLLSSPLLHLQFEVSLCMISRLSEELLLSFIPLMDASLEITSLSFEFLLLVLHETIHLLLL